MFNAYWRFVLQKFKPLLYSRFFVNFRYNIPSNVVDLSRAIVYTEEHEAIRVL